MRSRALPIVLLVLFLGLALGLISIPFLVREGTPVVSASAPLAFSADLGGGSANGRLQVAADRRFRATFRLSAVSGEGRAEMPVSLVLFMPEHAMSPLVPPLSRVDGVDFTASGILPMPGRWELRLETPDGQATIPFRVEG
jgi:hypothetical protein